MQLIVSLAWDWHSSLAVCSWIVSGVGMADHIKNSKKEAAQHISVSLGSGRKVVVRSGSQKIGSITRCSTRTRSQLAKRGQTSMYSLISCHVTTLPQRRTGQLTVESIAFHAQMKRHRVPRPRIRSETTKMAKTQGVATGRRCGRQCGQEPRM